MTDIIESTATDVTPIAEQSEGLAANIAKKPRSKPKAKSAAATLADALGVSAKPATRRTVRQAKTSAKEVTHVTGDAFKPADVSLVRSPLQLAVQNARGIHRQMKASFLDGISMIAEQVIAAKEAARAEGVNFDSLFGDPDDDTKFPFSLNWANTIVRVYESNLLTSSDLPRLPSDLTTLATLASVKPEKREAVLRKYEEIRTGDFSLLDGEVVLAKVTTQKAMKQAKRDVTGEGEEGDEAPAKAPKNFNATRMAKSLLKELGHDGLSELADAIELLLDASDEE